MQLQEVVVGVGTTISISANTVRAVATRLKGVPCKVSCESTGPIPPLPLPQRRPTTTQQIRTSARRRDAGELESVDAQPTDILDTSWLTGKIVGHNKLSMDFRARKQRTADMFKTLKRGKFWEIQEMNKQKYSL